MDSGRIIGAVGDPGSGRTVVAIGALHGNEPAGVAAIARVVATLTGRSLPLRGSLVGIVGNVRARAANRRFIDRDLNRSWSSETSANTAIIGRDRFAEDAEQRELLASLRNVAAQTTRRLAFLDLHTTSGPAVPFSVAPNLPRNRHLATALPIPFVRGLAEVIDGTLLSYLCAQGHLGLSIEGGQHDLPYTVDLLESALWLALVGVGLLHARHVPEHHAHRGRLDASAQGKPALAEIVHRHGVRPDDEFEMAPGYENFVPVRRREIVANDRRGPILAPRDGLMMLPRYQSEGDDGFFLARPAGLDLERLSQATRRAVSTIARAGQRTSLKRH